MIDRTLPEWHELRFRCTYCGARRGQPCRTLGSRITTNYHAARVQAANKVWFRLHPERVPGAKTQGMR